MKKFWIKLCNLTGQIFWYSLIVFASGAMVFLYLSDQKAAEKQQAATIEKPVALTPKAEPELQELEPISFSHPSNVEKMAEVKRKAKNRANNSATTKGKAAAKAVKPVVYSAPKKATPVEKPKPAATKPVAPTKTQIRRMAVNSAQPLHYGPSPETKERVQSILQFRATDNNVPTEVQRAKFNPKISGAGMSETELEVKKAVEKEKLDAAMKQFWATGEMQKR